MVFNAKRFLKDRKRAFTAAVVEDDWNAVLMYCRKYGIKPPMEERVLKGGIYKAVQECTDIPDDVKRLAAEKCIALGMAPTMWEVADYGCSD